MKNASIAGFAIAVASMVALAYRGALFAVGIAAIIVQVLAALLMVWARVTFGRRSFHASADPTEGGLVTSGPYKFVRHPIYAAAIYFTFGGVLSHLSMLHFSLAIVIVAGLAVRMLAEERLVAERYSEYSAYAARTRRIIPFIV